MISVSQRILNFFCCKDTVFRYNDGVIFDILGGNIWLIYQKSYRMSLFITNNTCRMNYFIG